MVGKRKGRGRGGDLLSAARSLAVSVCAATARASANKDAASQICRQI